MSIALFSHEIEEGQRKQNQKIKGRYTAAANQKDSSGDRSISELRRQVTMLEQFQEGDDAYAQQHRFKHGQ
jgi:hypothetical protein